VTVAVVLLAGLLCGFVWMVQAAGDHAWWWFLFAWACSTWLAWALWLELNDPRHYDPRRK